MRYIINSATADDRAALGGKARALFALQKAGLPIPAWFVVVPRAYDPSALQTQCLHPALLAQLDQALAELCPHGESVAVRSSASDEDGPQHSFAGQLESYLFVPPREVADRIIEVWRSAFTDRVVAYRREHGLPLPPRPPAVLVQRMINAEMAGVAFGADPVSGRRDIAVISAVYGLGSALVNGEVDADTFHVDPRGTIVHRDIRPKAMAHRAGPDGGVVRAPVPAYQASLSTLTDDQVWHIAGLVRQAGRFHHRPQDIEWAIAGERLWLLQSRPITALERIPDPAGTVTLWDNSNIAESYNGVTTPLTFSFARRAYEEVYRQFCKILKVPPARLERNDDLFPRMLGLIRGRIYYNLLSWYRALALLPGFTVNRRFMEQMMGVKEGMPEDVIAEPSRAGWRERLLDSFSLLRSMAAILWNHWTIGRSIRRFYDRLDTALGQRRPDYEHHRPEELADIYRGLERQLLTRWDAPLINDFLAMIFYGLLRKTAAKWLGDESGSLANDLLGGTSGIISAEPAARLRELAELVAKKPDLLKKMAGTDFQAIQAALLHNLPVAERVRDYLERFGDRCLEELKLESPTLHDNPLTFFHSIAQLARGWTEKSSPPSGSGEVEHRTAAAAQVRAILRFRPLRRGLFSWIVRNARARIRDRENLRFERTRLFGRVRQLFVELGNRLCALNRLDDARDVFYLEIEEVLGFIDGTATTADLRGLAAVRKAEFAAYRHEASPPDRCQTRGPALAEQDLAVPPPPESAAATSDRPTTDSRQGIGCCAGMVRGPVRVVIDPRQAKLQPGDILVAQRTDPGWIVLFTAAAGLIVERGSLLSHAAIVARELNLPAVISVDGATRWLRDGDRVELDGRTGRVTRLSAEEG